MSRGLAVLMSAGSAFLAEPAWAMYPKVEFDELVHASNIVFVGQVESMVPRRSDTGKAIVTDVTFRISRVMHHDAGLGPAGDRIVLTHAGGEVDGVGMSVSDMPRFEVGGEYLLFAFNDGKRYVNPIVGGPQGLFKVVRDEATGEAYALAPGGLGVASVDAGRLRLSPKVKSVKNGLAEWQEGPLAPQAAPVAERAGDAAAGVDPADPAILSVEELEGLIEAESETPLRREPALRLGDEPAPQEFDTPSKLKSSGLERLEKALAARPEPRKEARPDLAEVKEASMQPPEAGEDGESGIPMSAPLSGERAALCYCGYFDLHLVMEQVPTSWTSWDFNNDSMALYNDFMDIYRYVPDDGSFGDNSENEFAGWPSSATVAGIYGSGYGGALAVTWTFFPSGCPCCELSQADVMFNPAYSWTYSFSSALDQTPVNYQPVVIHELGHTWGFQRGSCTEDYSYSRPSVMHAYYNNIIEDGWGLHSWDAFAIRDLYNNQVGVPGRTDIGCESYAAVGGSLTNATTNTVTYRPGDTITINNLSVENMSTTAISGYRIRLWLSTNTTISTADHQMGGYWNWDSFGENSWWDGSLTTAVPNVPPGLYYVGIMVTRGGSAYTLSDDLTSNNTTYVKARINVIPPLPSNDESEDAFIVGLGSHAFDTAGATTDGFANANCSSNGTAYKDVWYRYTPLCDGTLTASTCGQASFDTVIVIYEDHGFDPPLTADRVACNDDVFGRTCSGNTSRVSVSVDAGQAYLIRVGGWSSTSSGTGTLTLSLIASVPNNSACTPTTIGLGSVDYNTNCATTDGVLHTVCQFDGQIYNDIWYRYTATCTGNLTVSTCNNADYDTDLAVYRAGACPPGLAQLLGCNDDAAGCGGFTSRLTVHVDYNVTYLIRVGGYQAGDAGLGTLTLSRVCIPPPCLGDANGSGAVTFADITSVLENFGAVYPGGDGPGDANNDGIVNFADITSVLERWNIPCPL
jgi:hypothetical protein